ncbi:caspase family protein [Bifidobacterium sp. MA2]|uniref:Caspase family protein n=1 Tax=Bifidobacterium santillanense TaxID=2809028 RepID=A0ABS5US32_9BIFI|nr:caspase family protein [Bifidobacterium santillanense]MBT1173814.1 caspase family protein [Bifidobacterium santillanense]
MQSMTQGQALYVGVQRYEHHEDLRCCRADARDMARALRYDWSGNPTWENRILVDGDADVVDEGRFRDEVTRMLDGADHDAVLLYYSGHACRLSDGDLLLATYEDDPSAADGDRSGLRFSELVEETRRHADILRFMVVILDCCHAGAIADIELPRNMAVLAASRGDEAAREIGGHGRFTAALLMGLDGASADVYGNVSVMSLYSDVNTILAMDGRGFQRPVFKAFLDRDIVLNQTRAGITPRMMSRLVDARDPRDGGRRPVFADRTSVFRPYPDMEAPEPDEDDERSSVSGTGNRSRRGDERPEELTADQRLMDEMKTWRDAHLIDIVDENGRPTDLYWACVKGGRISLTSRGGYYFDLMKRQSGLA